jgi:membrane protein YdbS with pleckstrin-like domain
MNTYRNTYRTSDDIRRAYMANTRRREISSYIAKALATPSIWRALFAIKVVLGIACAIALFSVIGLIDAGSMSAVSGIAIAIVIAAVESLCFIPIGENPDRHNKK